MLPILHVLARDLKKVYYIPTRDGQWKRIGKYGMTDDGQTMMITNDRGGKKLWTRSR